MSIVVPQHSAIDDDSIGDLDDIMIIMEDAFDPQFGEGWSRSQCSGIMADRNSWATLVHMGDRPVGFALSRMIVDEAELLLIATKREFRGGGAGKDLLNQVCRTAAAKGAKRLHLEVRDGNPAAKLYYAVGFERIGRRRNYYCGRNGERFDAITLAFMLDAIAE